MSEQESVARQRASRQAWISAGAPIVALVLVIILAAFAVFVDFARTQDRTYADSSRRLVASQIDSRLNGLSNITLDFASWNDAYAAIAVRWDQDWIDRNYYSAVTDGLIVFDGDGAARNVWLAEELKSEADTLPAEIIRAALATPGVEGLMTAATADETVTARTVLLGGRLALVSIAAVAPEDDAERLERAASDRTTYYLACIEILDGDEMAAIGGMLGLRDFGFAVAGATIERGVIDLPVAGVQANERGRLHWRDERPGSSAFAGRIGPVVLGLLLIGALTLLVARALVMRQVAATARAEAATESSRLKSEFISTMSHELRTPLNAIIGYAELIEEESPPDAAFADVRQDAARIVGAAQQLRQLIDDVLDQSRIDAGRLQLSPERIDVDELLAELEDVLAPVAGAKGVTLTVSAEAGASLVSDHQRLRQCLLNLASNAIKFTDEGGVAILARTGEMAGQPRTIFEVEDTGIGIAPMEAQNLFQPFAQASKAIQERYGGAGLGLSIARKLARALGGDITFESEVGKGSRFSLWLPQGEEPDLRAAA
jgi:signal transduction histidine kinase